MESRQPISRRTLLAGVTATLAGAAVSARAGAMQGRATARSMTVYRNPGCGCCISWANLARQSGYRVTIENSADMPGVKARLGVPGSLASCHTAVVGNYVVEGHVPLAALERLLAQRPADIRGIAVPGMPVGSPGMESPDGFREAFDIMAFHRNGRISRYS